MSKDVQIIPPNRPLATRPNGAVTQTAPTLYVGGIVTSRLARMAARRDARTINALSTRVRAETELFKDQTAALGAYIARERAGAILQELPDIIANDRAIRQLERADEINEADHHYELNQMRRAAAIMEKQTEMTGIRTDFVHAKVALVDAEQQLKAQREHGYFNYVLAHKKKTRELLDLELSQEERKAFFAKSIREMQDDFGSAEEDEEEIFDALYARREQLEASGLNTDKIDAAIAKRKRRRRR